VQTPHSACSAARTPPCFVCVIKSRILLGEKFLQARIQVMINEHRMKFFN
jgi:hypothetical protein